MAKSCAVCNKQRVFGNTVSHANNHSRRSWAPNLRRVRAKVDGRVQRIDVCSRCLRSGKVERAV